MDQRFDQVEKQMVRMETTQQMFMESTNQRFEQMLNMMDQRFAEQREDINQRFEQADKRFAEMMSFLQIITGIFTVIMAAAIGFAFWDRRTTGSKAKEVTLEALAKDEESRKMRWRNRWWPKFSAAWNPAKQHHPNRHRYRR
ncbi:MAG TPA: hypothetical protein EYG15_03250 [Deltaproteobacteria bacterium]|nr:hypothetical protein [Deltaproteobacteria bacterium]